MTLWFALPFQCRVTSFSASTNGPSTRTSTFFRNGRSRMSSQRNPVYSQMVFSGNFSWISSIRFPALLPVLPVERITAGEGHAGDPGWGQRLEKFLLSPASSNGSPPFTSHVTGFWQPGQAWLQPASHKTVRRPSPFNMSSFVMLWYRICFSFSFDLSLG